MLISANPNRKDADGLWRLLHDQVAPVLQTQHRSRFELLALFQDKQKTDVISFAAQLPGAILSFPPTPGFTEKLI